MKKTLIISLLLTTFTFCKSVKSEFTVQGEAQGTTYTVKYLAYKKIPQLKEKLDSLLNGFDESVSTYKANSLISQFNRNNVQEIDEVFETLFRTSKIISVETDGAFDPTIGPLISAWGFGFEKRSQLDSLKVDSLLAHCGFELFNLNHKSLIKTDSSATINFNAIAQGYAVDLMLTLVHSYSIENVYVELGGEIAVIGKNKSMNNWQIGIDKPVDHNYEREMSHIVSLSNKGMATSGNYRNFYEIDGKRYSHTINPKTGFPVEHSLLSATIIAKNCMLADAYATACMVMGVEQSIKFFERNKEIEGLLVFQNEKGEMETYMTNQLSNSIKTID